MASIARRRSAAAAAVAGGNEERFRSLIYTSSAIVWQATADGRLQVDHDIWRRFTGIDPGQDEWGWLEAVHPDLRGLCEEVIEEMQQAHPARMLSFEAAGDLRGQWDPDRVEQVISNLLGNAVAHGTGPVRVTCRDKGDEVVTTVHNQGRPIPAAAIPTLFEPFTRAAPDVDGARAKGLGLGLYIAAEIVHAHGGTISVTSTADDGTTFTIRWPRRVPCRHRTTTQPG